MGSAVYAAYKPAAALMDEADVALGYKISTLSFYGPEDRLRDTRVSQPAIYCTSVAALRVLSVHGIVPQACAGHSIGEYAALVAAGAFTFETGLHMVSRRSEFMGECADSTGGSMAALMGLTADAVKSLAEEVVNAGAGFVQPANFNGAGQVVVSGEAAGVTALTERAREVGARRAVLLPVAGAFHSKLMAPAATDMVQVLEAADIYEPTLPVISNVTASRYISATDVRTLLAQQISSPVRWEESVQTLLDDGCDTFVEVGAGTVLGGLLKRMASNVTILSTGDIESMAGTLTALAGAS